jgi:hypothetical protein
MQRALLDSPFRDQELNNSLSDIYFYTRTLPLYVSHARDDGWIQHYDSDFTRQSV